MCVCVCVCVCVCACVCVCVCVYSSHLEKDCPFVKKLQGEAGRIMFPEIVAELLLIRAINIHVKIAD